MIISQWSEAIYLRLVAPIRILSLDILSSFDIGRLQSRLSLNQVPPTILMMHSSLSLSHDRRRN